MIAVRQIQDIDIHSHGIIEASAGTGKTYTLENLVLHLIKNGADLEKILVVTFTEKATGELRYRIRSCIEKELQDERLPLNEKGILTRSLNHFENAQIFTIHGFCQRILKEYAFENSRQFTQDLVDDGPVYSMMLRTILREAWPARYKAQLTGVLKFSGYADAINFDRNRWEEVVLSVAQQWKPEVNEKLFPEPEPLTLQVLDRLGRDLGSLLKEIKKIVGPVDPGAKELNGFYTGYERLNFRKTSIRKIQRKVLLPLMDLLIDTEPFFSDEKNGLDPIHVLIAVKTFFTAAGRLEEFDENAFSFLRPTKWNKSNDNSSHVCPGLDSLIAGLNRLRIKFGPAPHHQLAVNTIKALKRDVGTYKEDHGLISYDDMLVLLHQSLTSGISPGAGRLCSALRDRYDFALVDEFQDTDLVQWHIFKTIFVDDSPKTGKRLFIIGDPKQAIYGFRGADVNAYFMARDYLIKTAHAKTYILPVNWRSIPALLRPLNAMFGSDTWFQEEGEIAYKDVHPPGGGERIARLHQDDSNRPAVVFVKDELKPSHPLGPGEQKKAQKKMATYIAKEIGNLLKDGGGLRYSVKEEVRQLTPGDICVLVRKASDARFIETELDQLAIPHTFYKKQGLYQSDEVMHLSFLIKAIASPLNRQATQKALLTRFFNIPFDALWAYENLPRDHAARRLFQIWQGYSQNRQWAKLFDSIVKDTGILYRDACEIDGDRRITNFEQVIQYLEIQIDSRHLDITGLSEHLDMLRKRSIRMDKDADLYRLETEEPTVQIMTIHAAKGMQFPVVFLAGGFTGGTTSRFFSKVHDHQKNVVYDLTNTIYKDVWQKEQQEEEKRLYYVALTRAMLKLYLPFLPPPRKGRKGAPVTGFIYDSISALPEELKHARPEIDPIPGDESPAKDAKGDASVFHHLSPKDLLQPDNVPFQHRRIEMDSFSGLMGRFHHLEKDRHTEWVQSPHGREYDADRPMDHDDDGDESETISFEEKEVVDGCRPLPGGKITGNLMHRIMEGIDFRQVREAASYRELLNRDSGIHSVVDDWMTYYEITDGPGDIRKGKPTYKKEICRWVWNVLHAPLIPDRLKLCDLSLGDRLNEQEFYYPYPESSPLPDAERNNQKTGYLNGSIDLVFRNKNRFYILDWKTNYLADGYGKDAVTRVVEEKYRLQLEIYSIAIWRWLSQLPGNMEFGGVYYLFLRGIDPDKTQNGIYFHQPSAHEIMGYERNLEALVQG